MELDWEEEGVTGYQKRIVTHDWSTEVKRVSPNRDEAGYTSLFGTKARG